MSKSEKSTLVPKAYPNVKTIVMREDHPKSKREPAGTRLGVWSYDLESPLTLKDGDQVLIKSSFVDTAPGDAGLITVSDDEVAALSITSGLYWQDSGCGQPIEAFATGFNGPSTDAPAEGTEQSGNPTYPVELGYTEGGPLPRMSQVLQSEGVVTTPNARNYICQNTTDDFGNTILYLNTTSALQGGGAVLTLGPPTGGWTVPHYVTAKNLRTTDASVSGFDLRVDIEAGTTAAPGVITAVTVNTEFSSGYGYSLPTDVNIIQAGATAAGQLDQAAVVTVTPTPVGAVDMALEFVPNEKYDPTKADHEYNDYTLANAVDSLITPPPAVLGYPTKWKNPGITPIVPTPAPPAPAFVNELNRVANICQLKVQTDTSENSRMFIYSYSFSQGLENDGTTAVTFPHDWKTPPDPASQSIATMTHSFNSDTGRPTFTFARNPNWDRDATLYNVGAIPAGHDSQGWYFAESAAGIAEGGMNFNAGAQAAFYRVCLGMWLWVWDPGLTKKGNANQTFPSQSTDGTNNYAINLTYYQPGVSIPGGGFAQSTPTTVHKLWNRAAKGDDNIGQFFNPQFSKYVNTVRSDAPTDVQRQTPDSDGFPAPESQFPTPPQTKGTRSMNAYPQSGSLGTCVPCWFGNMPDTSSDDARVRDSSTWKPFIYDSTPWVTHDSVSEHDSYNFKPFRVSCDTLWKGGRKEMADYPFAGIVCQDVRGPIVANPKPGQPPLGPPIATVPGIWLNGHEAKMTTVSPPPKFELTHECVLSKPFVPGSKRYMNARTYTTVFKDIPSGNVGGVDLTLKGGTYTYAGWARRLTDILNQVPPRRSTGAGVGFNGLSNNPGNPAQLTNVPTYTTTRLLTDTVELGYQGLQFPSNRQGQPWGVAVGEPPVTVRNVRTLEPDGFTPTTQQDSTSEQPYWMAESGGAIFRWKEGVADPNGDSIGAATVDPSPVGAGRQPSQVYGRNGPKYAGAESVSIVYNEAASAFEIVQMHSNLYSATSGAIITRQFQSGNANQPYHETMGDLSISDQDGGIFLTDWEPASIWHDKMNMDPNTLVHTGGAYTTDNDFTAEGSFTDPLLYPNLESVAGQKVNLIPGLNITGNFISSTALIDKRVNVPSTPGARRATDFLGGNFQSPDINFNLEVETDTPVTILGRTIIPSDITDPFFLVELSGLNRNEVYGLQQDNKLISQVVGRYFAVGSYTQGNADGSITYTHRGEPMLISELGIRILDSNGNEIDGDVLNGSSAVIIEIASTDVSLIEESVK